MNAEEFNITEKLYHYTTFDNAVKILLGSQLKFSSLSNMNDFYETSKIFGCDGRANHELLDFLEEEIHKYKQISLVVDKKRMGFDIPAMWGHYADKNHGVCIVLNKEKIIATLDKLGCYNYEVKYTTKACRWFPTTITQKTNIESYIKRNIKQIFYLKTPDWKYEQEFRVISKNKVSFLPLDDAILGVILNGHALSNEEIGHKEGLLKKLSQNVLVYHDKLFTNDVILMYQEEQIYPQERIINIAPKEMWCECQ